MRIIVVGDVVVDHHVYEGERGTPAAIQSRGVQVVREIGGAYSLCRLLNAMVSTFQNRRWVEQLRNDAEYESALKDFEEKRTDRKPEHELLPADPNEHAKVEFGLTLPDPNGQPCGHHAMAVFRQFPKYAQHADPAEAKKKVWRADLLLGYGHDELRSIDATASTTACETFESTPATVGPADILILDDAGFTFRNAPGCWQLPTDPAAGPQWIILKMSRPVCRGGLWQALQQFRDRLIVVVSATELRHEAAAISAGLSWERSVEDFSAAIHSDPVLAQLRNCRHLIVNFSADGALWIDNDRKAGIEHPSSPKTELIYDADSIEGQWSEQSQGEVFGYMSCMVAALTAELVRHQNQGVLSSASGSEGSGVKHRPDFVAAISCGLAVMRDLRLHGHGEVSSTRPNGYPVARLADVLANKAYGFSRCSVPWSHLIDGSRGNHQPWSISVQSQLGSGEGLVPVPMSGLAYEVVQRGRRMLNHLPHATFGNLFSIDRGEIETLRTLRRLMQIYRKARGAGKPLSIGVFGPPGAGKSFGVKQIANEVFGKAAWLEFNLSQFADSDLIGALHQVRDKVLEVGIPVVFWDEFDARQYHWLQYLLAPMQDGRFQEGQISHPIGQCVFIFAGATSHTFQQFGPARPTNESPIELKEAWNRYVLAKGPDFLSRLDGYYNVLGPNPRKVTSESGAVIDDPTDSCAPVRRALLLRQFLCGNQGHRLRTDSGLLRALLEVPFYRNGARSLEKLALSLKPSEPTAAVRRSSLGSPEQLAMFVDFPSSAESPASTPPLSEKLTPAEIHRRFMELCRANEPFQNSEITEALAASVHGHYQRLASQPGMTIQQINNREYALLSEDSKESNRAAARRISEVLAVAGLRLIQAPEATHFSSDHDAIIAAHIEQHLENMAELEHDLWCEERQSQGWRYGSPRHDARKIHWLLVPYVELPENEKDKDRNQIRSYPGIVAAAGLRITFVG
jgi:hypothetical protein